MTQHKWHKEIKAWADGAEIEVNHYGDEGWMTVDKEVAPTFAERHQYRIKPQPKEPQYLYLYCDQKGQQLLRTFLGMNAGETYIGKIKLEN